MAKGGSSTTQQQNVSQTTSVTVQNVIEGPKLEPLERLKLIADVFSSIDKTEAERNAGPQTVLSVSQIPGAAFLAQPEFIIMATAALAALMILGKRL